FSDNRELSFRDSSPPPGRIKKYLPDLKQGSVYRLNNFYGSKNKLMYRVADHIATCLSHGILNCRFFKRFQPLSMKTVSGFIHMKILKLTVISKVTSTSFINHLNYTLHENVLDVVGHMKLVNGQTLIERPTLDEVKIDTTRHIMVHVQSHDGPVMKLYLWDQAAADFCKKFNSYDNTPTVLLVTAVNTKRLGGTLALTSMSPIRVFMDYDVQPTIDYFNWLGSNPEIAKQVSADVVTKRETLTIADIFSYMKQESAKCTATIDDVVHGSAWYYIACSGCHAKATKGATSLVCTNTKCEKINTAGVPQYAVFVLLGDAGRVLTGRHASELVSSYFEANESEGDDHEVPVPEALISTIGQTRKFCVKVTKHNFSSSTRAITVTKILPLDTPPPTEASVGINIADTSEETVQTENEVCEPSKTRGDSADEESKRTFDSVDPEKAKRQRRDD
ncbi:unnamed protein product, partial [Brassica oleracea]